MKDKKRKNKNIYQKKFIIIFLLIIIIELGLAKLKIKSIKVCICTIGKNENPYVREYINYYKKYGVDKIFIYDNNEKNGEKFEDIIFDFITNGFVSIINYRGILSPQKKAYSHCYRKNYKIYNWLIFYDMDEFIFLKKYKNIKYFLIQRKFNKCQKIQLNSIVQTDNNLLYYENRSIFQRFPKQFKIDKSNISKLPIKTILKGNIKTTINNIHTINMKLINCDGFGKIINNKQIISNITDIKYFYIKHFYSKSTEEFIKKIMRGSAISGYKKEKKLSKIYLYFKYNKITLNKINFIEKMTKLNLNKYRKKIQN